MKKLSFKKGFTLIELTIVIAIIGVMAAGIISIVNPLAQLQKANDAERKSDLSQIQKALETFYQDNGKYPDTISFKIKNTNNGNAAEWGTDQWAPYMKVLPKDPSSVKNYIYYSTVDGQTYYLYASLDRGAGDAQACNGGNVCTNLPSGSSCGTGVICNYGVSTPNVSP